MEGAAFFMTQPVKCIFRLMVDTVRSGGREDGVTASALLTQACAIWFFALRRTLAL